MPTQHASRFTFHASLFYLLSLILFSLGLMCKPVLVTLPFLLLLLDYWPLNRLQLKTQDSRLKTLRPLFLEKLPFLLLAAASSVITILGPPQPGDVGSCLDTAFGLTPRKCPGVLCALPGQGTLAVEARRLLPTPDRLAARDRGRFCGAAFGGNDARDRKRAKPPLSVRRLVLVCRNAGTLVSG